MKILFQDDWCKTLLLQTYDYVVRTMLLVSHLKYWPFRLNLKDNHEFHVSGFCSDDECWRSYEQKVLGILEEALRLRTKLIRVIWRNTSECNFEDV